MLIDFVDNKFEISFKYNEDIMSWIKDNIPGRKWHPGKKIWIAPFSSIQSVKKLSESFRFKMTKETKDNLRDVIESNTKLPQHAVNRGLFKFQELGVIKLYNNKRFMLLDQMGLGKTVQAIMAIPQDKPVIVVCPATLKLNWQKEINKWRPELQTIICKGRDGFVAPDENQVSIINYEILPDNTKLNPDSIVIFDEIQYLKNYKSKRHKRGARLSKLADMCWGLTGTPLINNPFDLWNVYNVVGIAKSTFSSKSNFMKMFNACKEGWGIQWGKPNKIASECIKQTSLRRERDQVLKDMPDKIYKDIIVDISDEIAKKLDDIGYEIRDSRVNFGVAYKDNIPPFKILSGISAILSELKIAAMLNIVKDYEDSDEPLVVFSKHRAPIDLLHDRPGWATITGSTSAKQKKRIIEDFQSGLYKGIGCTIRSAGVGITLTYASSLLFVDLDWTPAANQQAESRIIRIGQESKNVLIMNILANHSLDYKIQKLLLKKEGYIKAVEDSSDVSGTIMSSNSFDSVKEYDPTEKKVEEKRQVNNIDDLLHSISSGVDISLYNGVYTLIDEQEHKTFKIVTMDKESNFAPGSRVIMIMTEYERFYPIGFVNNDGSIYVWKKHKNTRYEEHVLRLVEAIKNNDDNLKIARHCFVCNKLLTTPDSIEIGIGPVCLQKGR